MSMTMPDIAIAEDAEPIARWGTAATARVAWRPARRPARPRLSDRSRRWRSAASA